MFGLLHRTVVSCSRISASGSSCTYVMWGVLVRGTVFDYWVTSCSSGDSVGHPSSQVALMEEIVQ